MGHWQLCRREAKPRLRRRDCQPSLRNCFPTCCHSTRRGAMGCNGMGCNGTALAEGQREVSSGSRSLWQPRPNLEPTKAAQNRRWLRITVQLHQGTALLPPNSLPSESTGSCPSPTCLCWGPCKLQGSSLEGICRR